MTFSNAVSLSNALLIDSPYNAVNETVDPDKITDPKWLSFVAKTKITGDSPVTGEVITG